jgi:hypothetical protein
MAVQSDCIAELASPENCASPTSLKGQLLLNVETHMSIFESTPCLGRRVGFEHDRSTNEVYKEYYETNPVCLTDEEIGRMWWSRDELLMISRDVRAMASYYRKHPSDYTSEFELFFSKGAEFSNRRLWEVGLVHKTNQRPFRGLERLIHQTIPRRARCYVNSILKIQSKMTAKKINPELLAKLLCARSLQLSKPSRSLARVMAYQDYSEVAGIISEELGSSFATATLKYNALTA